MITSTGEFVDLSETVISVDRMGGFWRVLWNGQIVRTFPGSTDGHDKAMGYAMALMDERPLRKGAA